MQNKPVLVIIGEVHLNPIQAKLIQSGKLSVKVKEAHGVKRYVADIGAGGEETRESIRRLIEETMNRDIRVLKDEKITRLFLEEPASKGRKMAYSRYMKTHDIKGLKSALRMEREKENARSFELVKRFLHDSGIPKPIFDACMGCHKKKEKWGAYPVFDLPHANIAHKAGVFDIHPDEDEREFVEIAYLLEAEALLFSASRYLEMGWIPFQEMDGKSHAEALKEPEKIQKETSHLLSSIRERFDSHSPLREKSVCQAVTDNYIPGSAVVCGMDHVKPLKDRLSKDFEVKVYRIGEAFYKSLVN